MIASRTVYRSVSEETSSWIVTAAMSPRVDALTPSSRLPVQVELRIFGIRGFETATKMKDGRKIPKGVTWTQVYFISSRTESNGEIGFKMLFVL